MPIGRILYSGLADISLPYGPGVNERGFLKDMLGRFGDGLFAVLPRPQHGLPVELVDLRAAFIPAFTSVRESLGWLQVRMLGGGAVSSAIQGFKPDLIVLRTGALPIPHVMSCRGRPTPYVVKTAGDIRQDGFYSRNSVRRALRGVNDRMFMKVLEGAMAIDVVSERQRAAIVDRNRNLAPSVAVIDNGVDIDLFRPFRNRRRRQAFGFRDEEIVIGYVGNRPMQRGGKEVIDAVAMLSQRHRVRGLVVGDSGEAQACRVYAKRLGVSGLTVVYGEAEYTEIPSLMNAIDIGMSILRPRERGASEQKVRQYLACGLPVVVTAGSNNFLRGQDFARVVEGWGRHEVGPAVESLLQRGERALLAFRRQARAFAEVHLSLAARNEERLTLWKDALRGRAVLA